MPCKHYKEALIEAAASGAEPQGELRAHLDACLDCRAAFKQEQSLFASIDAGLHVAANAEMPASLLPRVRARLDEAAAPRRGWAIQWFAFASAVVVVVALFAARAVWQTNVVQKPIETARKIDVPPSPRNRDSVVERPVARNTVPPRRFVIFKNALTHESLGGGKTIPEVLVVHDQEALLAEYTEQWHLRKRAPLLAQDSDATVLAPLQVAQIQIDELNVKLLAEEKLQ